MLNIYTPRFEHTRKAFGLTLLAALGAAGCGGSGRTEQRPALSCQVERPGAGLEGDAFVSVSAMLGSESVGKVASATAQVDSQEATPAKVEGISVGALVDSRYLPPDGSQHQLTFRLTPNPGENMDPGQCSREVAIISRVAP